MPSVEPGHVAAAFLASLVAAAINSVAGGGTLISFPVLVALGLPSVVANATSTVGIWPGTLGSIWGFRRELARADPVMRWLVIPCFVGGAAGALLLRQTSSATFDRIVPFLVLFASILFAIRGKAQEWLRTKGGQEHRTRAWLAGAAVATLAVGVYGGYFGAGMSIMMLSMLGIVGMSDILEMNALTSLFSLCVNGVAIALFIAAKLVYWPFVLAMAVGALVGGYGAAGIARRIGRQAVSRLVIVVGFTVSVVFFVREFT
ncbi:sulfite exporter TauE/SafE family protein [Anaeromyxobacter terrae]|uniref:sulfite exporter TauE/SafE family protein n=1 Tax=Anaeromyxobacter terrae TaxID=2925406 RepID=UPI001F5AEF28|nr:sulfite exporter TauE/SafE family protein [Anaeromyxobacter sp. SG22]